MQTPHIPPGEEGLVMVPVLQMGKLRHQRVKSLAHPEVVELEFEPVRPGPRSSALRRLALPGLSAWF